MKFNNIFRYNISLKIFIILISIVILQAAFLYWQSSLTLKQQIINKEINDVKGLLISQQQILGYLSEQNSQAQIQQTITALAVDSHLKQALLIDHNQKIIAATKLSILGKQLSEVLSAENYKNAANRFPVLSKTLKNSIWLSADNMFLSAITPIKLGRLSETSVRSDKVGFLYVHYDLSKPKQIAQQQLRISFIPELIMLLVTGLGLAWYFQKNIGKRIQQLRSATQDMARFDYSQRIILKGDDEITELSKSFNEMAEEIQQRHHQLLEREQNLAVTLNSIGDAVIVTNKNAQVTRMNPVAENLTGWKQHEAINLSVKDIFRIVNASTREVIENPVEKVLATGETVYLSNHTTLIAKDNTEYQIADSAAPIRDTSGKIEGMVLVFNDVTEQYKLRESLRQKEREQHEILHNMVDAVITIDEDGIIITFNKAAEDIFGYSAESMIHQNVNQLMPEPYSSAHNGYLQNYITTNEKKIIGIGREVKGLRKNGEIFPMRLLIAELPDNGSGKRRFIGTCHDLTYSKLQEEQLRQSQKMDALGKLTGGIAHDYNNMLGVIIGYSELLQQTITDKQPNVTEYINQIIHAGKRGSNLTKKLLSFSRKRATTEHILNINQLLLNEKSMLEKALTIRIKLVYRLDDKIWPIFVDSNDLEDTILNLSINAMHAMENEGNLVFETCNKHIDELDARLLNIKQGDYVLLRVIDNGCGMDAVTREKIFDPFFSTKGEQGTGLGLSQTFAFIERSGGAIKVDSIPDEGSKFTLYFPRYDIDKKGLPEQDNYQKKTEPLYGNATILVVDDEPALVNLAKETLTQHHYSVLTAENGQQALDILRDTSVDIVLTDVIMPDMDGYELAAIIQQKYPQIKIQLVSGFSDDRHIDRAATRLHNELLSKPYSVKTLLKKIYDLLH